MPNWWTELCQDLSANLKGLQVGVYASGGSPYHHLALASLWGATAQPIRAEAIKEDVLENIDVLIFPGGGFTAMTGMLEPLGIEGATKVRQWVEAGGMYVGSCAGSFLPVDVGEGYWKAHPEAKELHMVSACLANSSDSIFEGLTSPGVGVINVQLSHLNHWLTQGLRDTFEMVHYNGPLFDLSTSVSDFELSKPTGVLQPIAATVGFTASENFLNESNQETLLDRCIKKEAFNGIVTPFGSGNIVLFGSHPEFGFDVLQLGWKEPVKLLANALSFQANIRKSPSFPAKNVAKDNPILVLRNATKQLKHISASFQKLTHANTNGWMDGTLPSFLGLKADSIWSKASQTAAQVAQSSAELTANLSQRKNLTSVMNWLDNPPKRNQDVGFMGLMQLLSEIEKQLELSFVQLQKEPVPLEHAYDGFGVHPYQIVASTYLSAAGLTAAAHLLCVSIAKLSQNDDLIPLNLIISE